MTPDEVKQWLRRDGEVREVLVELDYVYQDGVGVSAVPTVGTYRFSIFGYVDESTSPPTHYESAIVSAPAYERSLDRSTLRGNGSATLTDLVINNADQRWTKLLYLALDGSDCRVYVGSPSWAKSDFVHLFTSVSAKASALDEASIAIQQRDVSLLLNKRVGGTNVVGGTGPSADKFRPLVFGFVHNMEPVVLDSATLKYVYSDVATNASVVAVRDRGVAVTFTDNADGTFTLAASPAGQITCDPLIHAASGVYDYYVSDALSYFIGDVCGLTAKGKYGAIHGTYFDSDGATHALNDYHCGKVIWEKVNANDLVDEFMNTANGFASTYRTGEFYFGRMRPDALSDVIGLSGGRLTISAEISDNDIKLGSLKIDHNPPTYVGYQSYANFNQSVQSDLASSLTPDQRGMYTRKGLYSEAFKGEEVGTTQYLGSTVPYKGGAPELYHLTLSDSEVVETLISGPDDTSVIVPSTTITVQDLQAAWSAVRRAQYLPWTEFVDFVTFLDLYDLEIGDVVNLTYSKFDLSSGALHQVYRVKIDPTKAEVELGVVRRRFAGVSGPLPSFELREDGGVELREDGGYEEREEGV